MKNLRLLLIVFMAFLGVSRSMAQEAYAVVTKNDGGKPVSVTFYYDTNKASFGSDVTIVDDLNADYVYQNWAANTLTSATFDASFANYHGLTSLYYWFNQCSSLTTINGLEYLNTENVTTMASTFQSCRSLTELDLSHFNTAKVESMYYMFGYCQNLVTIYVGDGWSTEAVLEGYYSEDVFYQSPQLVGGYGTIFSSNNKDVDYARIDAIDAPGYLSRKGDPVAYAVVTKDADNKPNAVTFYYDTQINTRTGENVTIVRALNSVSAKQNWYGGTLTSATFDDSFSNYHGMTDLRNTFYGCTSLTTINGLSNLNTENVTTLNSMFYFCNSLTGLDLTHFNTAKVTDMQYMFYNCSSLAKLNISSFNTAEVTTMYNMFNTCSSLKELDLTNFDVSKVTNFTSMFYSCSLLETIYATGDWNTDNNASSSNMFYYCQQLVGGATTSYNLNIIDITYAHVDGGTSSPGYFTDKTLPMPYAVVTKNENNKPVSVTFYYDKNKDSHIAENVTIVRALNTTTVSEKWKGSTLTSATFDASFANFHGMTRLYGWFGSCSNLTAITGLTNLNTENVTTMYALFSGCSSLTELDLSHFNTEMVTDMSGMFNYCTSLTELDLSGFNTANVTTMANMFNSCSSLTELDVTNFDVSKVTNTGYMFASCTLLETIYATQDWSASTTNTNSGSMFSGSHKLSGGAGTAYNSSKIDKTYARLDGGVSSPGYFTDKTLPRAYAVVTKNEENKPISVTFFYDTNKDSHVAENVTITHALNSESVYQNWAGSTLTSVTFDASFADFHGLTSLYYWFSQCSNLTTITGLEYLNTENVTMMTNMFTSCSSLTELDLSNFNTAKVTDMSFMFNYCNNLEVIYAGEGWNTENVQNASGMFVNDEKLVGSYGTSYNRNYQDLTYACLDGGPTSPGYLSQKGVDLAYAVVTKDTNGNPISVAFYYDKNMDSRVGENVTIVRALNTISTYIKWKGSTLTSVTFDASIADYDGLTSFYRWFDNCTNLTAITGLENLNTGNVTTMESMFYYCTSLIEVDLTNFDVSKVTNTNSMFYNCSNLETIYATSDWNTETNENSNSMFSNCQKLVGGAMTKYNNSYIKKEYARLDGGPSNPGYFTDKTAPIAYAVVTKNEENKPVSVAFYYDKNKDSHIAENVTIVRALNAENAYQNWYGNTLTSVTFDDSFADFHGLTSLYYWFSQCTNLTSITGLEYLNTENVTNMTQMFYKCSSLTELDLTGFDVSKVTNTSSMFNGCSKLETIYATSDWSVLETITNSGSMFSGCPNLCGSAGTVVSTSSTTNTDKTYARLDGGPNSPGYFSQRDVDIAYAVVTKDTDGNPISVTFYYDKNKDSHVAENVTIVRALNTSSAYTNWYGATLTTVTFDESFADYHGLTSFYMWFYGCTNLTSINGLDNLNTENVTNMANMFYNCSSLTELDLTNFDVSNVTNTGSMFYNCTKLETIYATSDWSASSINTSSSSMFYGCQKLVGGIMTAYSVSYTNKVYAHLDGGISNPGYFTDKTKPIAYAVVTKNEENKPVSVAFYYDKNKASHVAENVIIVRTLNAENVYQNWAGTYQTPSTLTSATFDASFADCNSLTNLENWFYNCPDLTSITGSEYLNTENVTNMSYMFDNCSSLTELDLSHFNTENVTDMKYMFYNCSSLAELDVSHFNTENVADMKYMFYNCRALGELDLTSFNTENVTDMRYMFYYCMSLTELDLSNFDVSKVTSTYYMFYTCNNLKTIYAKGDWKTSLNTSSTNMFYDCLKLVGGANTHYNINNKDISCAHVDGGTANPGYFTDKDAFLRGDVNGDKQVSIADVTALVNIILGKTTDYNATVADVNTDLTITIADVTALVNIILGKE